MSAMALQVPEDFNKDLLLPLDYEDKYTFNKTLEEAFVERWLVLRLQVSCPFAALFHVLKTREIHHD